MQDPISILLVSESSDSARTFTKTIENSKFALVESVDEIPKALELLQAKSFPLILCDSSISKESSANLLSLIRKKKINTHFVLLVNPRDESWGDEMVKLGAYDYIIKNDGEAERIPHFLRNIYDRIAPNTMERNLEEEIRKQRISLHEINQKLEAFSIRDELTDIYNHRYFQEKLGEEFSRAKRYNHSLSCMMLDIDYFKSINDVRGHLVGDEILKELAQFLVDLSRQADVVARYGGEEFVILLPHISYEGASFVAERVRKAIAEKVFLAGRFNTKLTVSIGLASFPEDSVQKSNDLVIFADQALYRAKGAKGRNSVCAYSSIMKEIEDQTSALQFSADKMVEFRRRLIDVSEMAKRAYIESTKTLVYALEAKDKYTLGHAARVGQYSAMIAKEMGLPEDDVITIEHAGLLHDVGKACISDEILLKPGAFTNAEYEKMREHPILGYQIMKPIKFLREEALITLHHHEWFNGQGYPHRLKGKEIPIGARIVAVLDAYDTMRAAGSRYKKAMSSLDSLKELIRCSGTQFDPEVVMALSRVLIKRGEVSEKDLEGVKPKA